MGGGGGDVRVHSDNYPAYKYFYYCVFFLGINLFLCFVFCVCTVVRKRDRDREHNLYTGKTKKKEIRDV